jgi:Tfp pilus assembly protein PilF
MTTDPQLPASLVEAALGRVLSNPAFRGSPRLRRFLEYVVRQALAGEEDHVKEYTIGVEVFDRGPRFDPRVDAIVRVEALKLRQKLAHYYRTDGATDPVTIALPKGAYRPVFESHRDLPPALLDDPAGLYWQARTLLLGCTGEAIGRARRYLAHAVERWPTRVELHVALAEVMLVEITMEHVSPETGVPVLQLAAHRALALDPSRADARFYAALPQVRQRDTTPVARAAREAVDNARSNALAQYWVASTLAAQGQIGEALIHADQAVRLQPSALFFRTWRALNLFAAGHEKLAIRHLLDVLEIAPDDYLANHFLGELCALTGRPDEAREAAANAHAMSGSTQALCGLGLAEASAARTEAAEAILEELTKAAPTRYVAPTGLAAIHLALGRLPPAATELARARREGDWWIGWAAVDPRWGPIRGKLAGF